MHDTPPPTPARRETVLAGLAWSVAALRAWIMRVLVQDAAVPHNAMVISNYIGRTHRRLVALLARLAAGTPPRARLPRPQGPEAPPRVRATPRLRLPGRKAWLATAIGWYGRGYASQISHALSQPETADLIAASPQAQRLLRPLCRMLAIDLPALPPLPRRPRPPRPPRAPQPRRLTRRQREAILWYPNSEGKPMQLLPKKLPRD